MKISKGNSRKQIIENGVKNANKAMKMFKKSLLLTFLWLPTTCTTSWLW